MDKSETDTPQMILAGVRDNLLKPMAGEIITQQAEQIKSLQENLALQQQENLKNIAWIKIFLILIVVLQISMAMLFSNAIVIFLLKNGIYFEPLLDSRSFSIRRRFHGVSFL